MKQRIQVTVLLVVIGISAVLIGRELTGQESLLGPRGERGLSSVPFEAKDVPVIVLAAPGPMPEETFERPRKDIFSYQDDPAEEERKRLAAEEAKRKAEEERQARLAEQRELDAERARLEAERKRKEREAAEAARLARLAEQDRPPPPPPEPPPPEPPDFPYRYDGRIGPRDDAIAILRDREDDFAYARAGQVLDESFRIERVGKLKLVLSFTDPLFEGEFRQVPLRDTGAQIGGKQTARQ